MPFDVAKKKSFAEIATSAVAAARQKLNVDGYILSKQEIENMKELVKAEDGELITISLPEDKYMELENRSLMFRSFNKEWKKITFPGLEDVKVLFQEC